MKTRTRAQVYRLWLEELRAGRHKQTRGQMRDEQGFDPLGVLCDLARRDGGPQWNRGHAYMGATELLPPVIAEWMGLSDVQQQRLTALNDMGHHPFSIAGVIQAEIMRKVLA